MADFGAHILAWLATAWLHALVLFAVVWAAERLGRLGSLALRQTAWRAVLLVPLLSAALQVFVLDGSPTARSTIVPAAATLAAAPAPLPAATLAPAPIAPASTPTAAASLDLSTAIAPLARRAPAALGWAWVAWICACAGWIALQRLRLRRYRLRLAPVQDAETLQLAQALRRDAGLARLRLREDPTLSSPIALAPATVVIPSWTRSALTGRQLGALLAHEVRHLSRHDPQWRALAALAAAAVLAPHGRLVLRRLEALAEHACDGWSARRTGDGAPLAECIAACLERGLAHRAPSLAAAMAQMDSPLLERVRRLLEDRACEPEPQDWRDRLMLIGALGAAAVALPGFAIGHVQAARPAPLAPEAPAAQVAPIAQAAPVAQAAAQPIRLAVARPAAPMVAAGVAVLPAVEPGESIPPIPVIPPGPTEPAVAAIAALPNVPDVPDVPAVPAVRALPAVPAVPAVPPAPPEPAVLPGLPELPVPPTPPTPPDSPY